MKDFSSRITNWYSENKRELPWRNTKNPFKIWLSEIILQQTRVIQGMDYYHKFTERFSTPKELAEAPLDEVLKLWQGLGYYSRARNLHNAAIYIKEEKDGAFPDTYNEIVKLKGVGEYTAAAISSFAFNEPHAVVDGNVYRVLSRIFGIETGIDTTKGKKEFKTLADTLINKKDPGTHNQAIMEFGALHCTPKSPDCSSCIFNDKCYALKNGLVDTLPIKEKNLKQKHRFFYYIILKHKDIVYIQQRVEKDIWLNLYQFPLIETNEKVEFEKVIPQLQTEIQTKDFSITNVSKDYKHILSHQVIHAQFIEIQLEKKIEHNTPWIEISTADFGTFAIPRLIDRYINEFGL